MFEVLRMKVGLIRCMQTEDMCNTTLCLREFKNKEAAFKGMEHVELVCMNFCGGCPGKKAVARAQEMVRAGAEAIALASCMGGGSPIGFACPHFEQIKKALKENLPSEVLLIEYTH
jgi:predicted metal-binding protein